MTSSTTPEPITERPHAGTQPAVEFSLRYGEPADEGAHRILLEQMQLGAWHMERARVSDFHVHEVRKATKRVRAVLRMVRDDIDSQDYARLNGEVRDLARDLSELRSAVVQVHMLESVISDDDELAAESREIHESLVATADRRRENLEKSTVTSFSFRLDSICSDIEDIRIVGENGRPFGGVQATYRRGRRSMVRAYADPTVETFHLWRKQVKYLRHQMEILQAGAQPSVAALVSDLEEIGEGLGMDHDLADLQRATDQADPRVLSRRGRHRLNDVIGAKRAEVQNGLGSVASRTYGDKPRDFANKVIPPNPIERRWRQR